MATFLDETFLRGAFGGGGFTLPAQTHPRGTKPAGGSSALRAGPGSNPSPGGAARQPRKRAAASVIAHKAS